METMTKNYAERVKWETIRQDCKLPESDNNDGFTFGLHYIDFEGEGDILDTEWFKSNEERELSITENNLVIVFG